ncbi:MAG: hypothetical protein ABI797_04630 [Chloroflexota bacterium]
MTLSVILPAVGAVLALIFALALLDQWRERRRGFQLIWAIGMIFFAIADAAEAIGGAGGWSELLYRTWYLTGAVFTAGWLGLGTAYLLGKTRFGYAYALLVFFGGFLAFVTRNTYGAGTIGLLVLIAALVVAIAIAVETYFQNERWPQIAAAAVICASIVGAFFAFTDPLSGALPAQEAAPTGAAFASPVRIFSLFLNVPGGIGLVLGAFFSAYVFMPKKRFLPYSLDPGQKGDQFLFNIFLAIVAIPVNFLVSLPGAIVALFTGRIHSRVPATLLIGVGAIITSATDALSRLGSTDLFQLGKFVGLLLIFLGFLVSVEVFRDIRIPFTGRVLRAGRQERAAPTATD